MSDHGVPGDELHNLKKLRDTFNTEVAPFVFRNRKPSSHPTLVLLGAQPAAGKSKAQAAIIQAHPDMVPLTGDALRRFHSDYDTLMEHAPLAMPNATARASGAWVKMSIDHARDNGYSLLVEGTFHDPQMTLDTARDFDNAGHQVHLVALGVNERISRLDAVNRYLDPNSADANRWTPATAHDLGYRMSPHTVRAAEDSPHVHRITITDRTGEALFSNSRTPDGAWAGPTGAADALLASRERPLEPDTAREWLARRDDYTAALIKRDDLVATTRPTLEQLHADADIVARQAWPDPEDARHQRRHRANQRVHRHILDSAADGVPNDLLPTRPDTFLASDTQLAPRPVDSDPELDRERERRGRLPEDRAEREAQVRSDTHALRRPPCTPQPPSPEADERGVAPPQKRRDEPHRSDPENEM
ncbi:hypothetical protein HNR06_004884 [Nocardiopsis arvandica]|uniref:UDP-N-acetylglucosamine kinase n=1 Tax=Nocardiopsis sinuspersici TaxID=501010 RepID=A0A7Y9XIX9_9ACTN|nr:hypothetical protein [Nocardiopsis sinuspersici]